MFTGIHFIPPDTKIGFVRLRTITWVISALLTIVPLLLVWKVGLNFGIDFQGGTLIEIQTKESVADLGDIRAKVHGLDFGEVQVQEFGAPNAVLIRIAAQPTEKEQQESISKVKQVLGDQVDYRRIEVVGPTVSSELIAGGTVAVVIAMIGILLYIWFRFEWQFAVAAIASLVHDVTGTIGLYSLLQLEFNLSSIAAILTIIGYSLNDKVVIFDRIRENLRKYRKMPLDRAPRPVGQRDAVANRAHPRHHLPRHDAVRAGRRRGDLRLRARHVLGHRHRRLFVDLCCRTAATDPRRQARRRHDRSANQDEGGSPGARLKRGCKAFSWRMIFPEKSAAFWDQDVNRKALEEREREDAVRTVARDGDPDRYASALFAPRPAREPLFALYALNVELARAAEQVSEPQLGEIRLQWWREALDRAAAGEDTGNPVADAVGSAARRYALSGDSLAGLIDARSFDVSVKIMPDTAALDDYLGKTAGALFRLAAEVTAPHRTAEIEPSVRASGIAYGLTGLMRALPVHASRGRVDLPAETLLRHGTSPEQVLAGQASKGLAEVLAEFRETARVALKSARAHVTALPREARKVFLPLALVDPYLSALREG